MANVSHADILNEYRAKHYELSYTVICQQLAIKKLEEEVQGLKNELDLEKARADGLASRLEKASPNEVPEPKKK